MSWDRATYDDGDLVPLDQLEVTLHMHQQVVCRCTCAMGKLHSDTIMGCAVAHIQVHSSQRECHCR